MRYTLTFHYAKNYGAFLQCYALQSAIKNSIVLNYIPYWTFFASKKLPVFFRWVVGSIRKKKNISKFKELSKIRLSNCISSELDATFLKSEDYLVIGSDQVWNPLFVYDDFIYFGKIPQKKVKRISYAVSMGMTHWPKEYEKKVLPLLKNFSAISVREESSAKYLKSLGLKNVVCVCDPTILHKADFYRKEFPYEYTGLKKIFVYIIREKIPENVLSCFPEEKNFCFLNKKETLISVSHWLSNIDNSTFIITDSFHCVVFCLLFHKPFLVIFNQSDGKGMNERFATLLGKIHLEYRCLNGYETSAEILEIINKHIDWNVVVKKLDEWRKFSLNWLMNALEN